MAKQKFVLRGSLSLRVQKLGGGKTAVTCSGNIECDGRKTESDPFLVIVASPGGRFEFSRISMYDWLIRIKAFRSLITTKLNLLAESIGDDDASKAISGYVDKLSELSQKSRTAHRLLEMARSLIDDDSEEYCRISAAGLLKECTEDEFEITGKGEKER